MLLAFTAEVSCDLICCSCVFLQPSISNVEEDEGIVDEIKKLEEAICKEVFFSSNTILIYSAFLVSLASY